MVYITPGLYNPGFTYSTEEHRDRETERERERERESVSSSINGKPIEHGRQST